MMETEIPPFPGPDDPIWQELEREDAFWDEHHNEFLRKYPDKFVAVKDGRVIAVADHLDEFDAEIERQGLNPREVWTHYFMTPRPLAL
jgi:hypothetical protein